MLHRPCIMHHLAMSEENGWNYCPLCEDFVYGRDLRSVVVHDRPRHALQQYASFKLMARHKDSIFVAPREQFPHLGDGIEGLTCKVIEAVWYSISRA